MLKKTILILILIGFISPLAVFQKPALAAADWKTEIEKSATGSPISEPKDVFKILNNVLKYAYTIFFITAIFFILLAAYSFLFARGDPEKVKSARQEIYWAAVAIAVGLLSVGAAKIIDTFLRAGQ